jgi:dolichol-phosphate mannosyltransferase
VCNEAENVGPLAEEIRDALQDQGLFELIFVDDGSTDATACAVVEARAGVPQIRLLRHLRRCGQSAAICTGIRAAQGAWVATLDGDGQNDPADIPTLLRVRSEQARPNLKLIMGNRKTRRDTWIRRISSRVANGVRSRMLNDGTPDTGCGLKLFERIVFMELPHFDHMHRFLPALFQRAGAEIMSVPVRHRARTRGMSKYGLHNRLWVGIVDLFGMRWLIRRALPGHSIIEE